MQSVNMLGAVFLDDVIFTEVDINFHYRIDKYVLFRFNGGYLFADKGTGISDSDNAWRTETSISVDF